MESRSTVILGKNNVPFTWTPIALTREAGVNKDTIFKRSEDGTRRFGDLLGRLEILRQKHLPDSNKRTVDQRIASLSEEKNVLENERQQLALALKAKISENAELMSEITLQSKEADEWRRKYYKSIGRIPPKQ